jgi:predicted HTH transcriptional regulator
VIFVLSTAHEYENILYENMMSILWKIGLPEHGQRFHEEEVGDVDTMLLLSSADLKDLGLNKKQQSTFRYKMIVLEHREKIIDRAYFKKTYPLAYEELIHDLEKYENMISILWKIGLPEHGQRFHEEEVCDVDTMLLLRSADLKDLGLNKKQHSTFRYKMIALEHREKIIDRAYFKKTYPLAYEELIHDLERTFGFRLCIHDMVGHDCHFTYQTRPTQDDEEVICLCPCCKEEAGY